jgi:hypothetical protein
MRIFGIKEVGGSASIATHFWFYTTLVICSWYITKIILMSFCMKKIRSY